MKSDEEGESQKDDGKEENPGKRKRDAGRRAPTPFTDIRKMAGANEVEAERAFTRIIGLYKNRVLGFIRMKIRNWHDAEDLYQRFSMRLWSSRRRYKGMEAAPGHWTGNLLKLANWISLDFIDEIGAKMRDRRVTTSLGAVSSGQLPSQDPANSLSEEEIRRREMRIADVTSRAIGRLPEIFLAEKDGSAIGKPGVTMEDVFAELVPFILADFEGRDGMPWAVETEGKTAPNYPQLSEKLGVREVTLRTYLHRMNKTFAFLIYQEAGGPLDKPTPSQMWECLLEYAAGG